MAGGHNTSFETSFFGIAESSDYIQRVVEYQSFRETRKIKAILATLEAKTAIFQQWNYILQSWTVILCSLMYRWFWPQTWLAKIFFLWEIFDWKQGLNDLTLTNNSVDTNQFDGMNLMGLTAISAGYRKTAQMKKNYLKEQSQVLFWDRFPKSRSFISGATSLQKSGQKSERFHCLLENKLHFTGRWWLERGTTKTKSKHKKFKIQPWKGNQRTYTQ